MSQRGQRDSVQRLTLSGILLGIMLVLGFVEHSLPAPGLPGMKLGLSNGVLIFAVSMLDLPTAWCLMAMKVILSGFLFSGLSAMMYAFAGGVLSMAVMSVLSRIPKLPVTAVSAAGGVAHNVGQVLMAMWIARLPSQMLLYMALLVAAGAACGVLTGVTATMVIKNLRGSFRLRPRPERDRRALIIIAAVLLLAAGLIAWQSQPKISSDRVEITTQRTTPAPTAE